ncbi:c-type cytochrome [Hydrogenophaga laconesensis]|uniref:Cytochrome c553 n=1 Tax=Hydrogenophaga laconesensis TaxID=1805971 RepID=A0ABU1VE82_9BURK|nr:c-type cytochrome [Hydrogenophaga laconesensis]MDR7095767.1 cytochrome c553 [Hydrogenophaga laconesensis]
MKTLHALFLGLAMLATGAWADAPVAPKVDTGPLPAIAGGWADINPLRGNAAAIQVGREAFNQACAACHGADANGARSPAPDLRRMGRSCQRVQDEALRQRCQSDADHFFVKSVRYGKQKFGIVHMPPWEGVLEPSVVWSLRTFVENAPMQ